MALKALYFQVETSKLKPASVLSTHAGGGLDNLMRSTCYTSASPTVEAAALKGVGGGAKRGDHLSKRELKVGHRHLGV